MTGIGTRIGVAAIVAAALGVGGVPSAFADAPDRPALAQTHREAPVRPHDPLDGFTVDCLPAGLGAHMTGFEYEWEDVSFRTRVWETGPDERGAYHTDLNIFVLRGEKLRDIQSLRDFLAYYEEKDSHWRLSRFTHDDAPGYIGDDQAFFSPQAGVGVLVKVYDERFDADDVRTVIGGMHRLADRVPEQGVSAGSQRHH